MELCVINSLLPIKIPERRQQRRSDVFIVNFAYELFQCLIVNLEQFSHIVLVFALLTLSK